MQAGHLVWLRTLALHKVPLGLVGGRGVACTGSGGGGWLPWLTEGFGAKCPAVLLVTLDINR